MSSTWLLGDFSNGNIMRKNLVTGKGSATVDILSTGTADVPVDLRSMTNADRKNWENLFQPNLRFIALDNADLAWNNPNAVGYAGYIDKVSANLFETDLKVQAIELGEYLKGRTLIDDWGTVTDPTETRTFSGIGWAGVIREIIEAAFASAGIPADAPKPPQVLGTFHGTDTGSTITKKSLKTDAVSYADFLNAIKETDSPDGREWTFKPRWASSARNRIVWDVYIGTASNPHLNEKSELTIALKEDQEYRFGAYDLEISGTEVVSKIYIQSKAGTTSEDGKTGSGADLRGDYVVGYPILFEEVFNPSVELNEPEFNAQLNSRIKFAGKPERVIGLSFEEKMRPSDALDMLGKTLNLIGVDGTKSEGFDATVRLVSVSYTPGESSVALEVMNLAAAYPRLPKDRRSDLGKKQDKNMNMNKMIPSSFGGITPPGGGGDGGGDGGAIGPGGEFGSGTENDKKDQLPYNIVQIVQMAEAPPFAQSAAQDSANVIFGPGAGSFETYSNGGATASFERVLGKRYGWDENVHFLSQNTDNANVNEGTTHLGSGYLQNGSFEGWVNDRFPWSPDSLVANILLNPDAYHLQCEKQITYSPDLGVTTMQRVNVSSIYLDAHPIVVRDRLFYAFQAKVIYRYRSTTATPEDVDTYFASESVFWCYSQIASWTALGDMIFLPNSPMLRKTGGDTSHVGGDGNGVINLLRVGDWVIMNKSSTIAANFGSSGGHAVNESSWIVTASTIPDSLDYGPNEAMAFADSHYTRISLTTDDGVGTGWALTRGSLLMRMAANGYPTQAPDATWVSVPALEYESIANFGGWGMMLKSKVSSDGWSQDTEVLFQDNTGSWQLCGTLPFGLDPQDRMWQIGNWVYVQSRVGAYQDKGRGYAFKIIRAAEWALST